MLHEPSLRASLVLSSCPCFPDQRCSSPAFTVLSLAGSSAFCSFNHNALCWSQSLRRGLISMGVEEYGFLLGRFLTFALLHPYLVSPSVWAPYHLQVNLSAWSFLTLAGLHRGSHMLPTRPAVAAC